MESLVRELICEELCIVELYANRKGSWALEKRASPGCIKGFEDILFDSKATTAFPSLMSVHFRTVEGKTEIGAAFVDPNSNTLGCICFISGVCQFLDNELFSNLESFILQVAAKECILPADSKEMSVFLGRLGLDKAVHQVASTFRLPFQLNEQNFDLAIKSLYILIEYLGVSSDLESFSLMEYQLNQYMKMDHSALRALNVFPSKVDKQSNLFDLLNKCLTPQGTIPYFKGSRLLNQWLRQPLVDLLQIAERLNLVEFFVKSTQCRVGVQEWLKSASDLSRIVKRFSIGRSNLQDVVRLYQVIKKIPDLAATISGSFIESFFPVQVFRNDLS
jgi:DNA mismatch repair protein MSH2